MMIGVPDVNLKHASNLGIGPWTGVLPLPVVQFLISGVTKDSAGTVLANCVVKLYRTADDTLVDTLTSGSDGSYTFRSGAPAQYFYVVAYKAGAPDVAGTTVNTLTAA